MAWIGRSQGVFRLHDSDRYCGSYLSIADAAEILEVDGSSLAILPSRAIDSEQFVNELDLHKAWGAGRIPSPQKPRQGTAKRSFDELIVRKLLQVTLPGCLVECQVPFGGKHVDLKLTYDNRCLFIEFDGPSHFTPQYQRQPTSPIVRRKAVEDHFGCECVIWPFWIQRCTQNVLTLMNPSISGLASVWSTKALFGDFVFPESADIILDLTRRFNAVREEGIGYMYGNTHTNKPIHPIVRDILRGKEEKRRLIPKGTDKAEEFWLPEFGLPSNRTASRAPGGPKRLERRRSGPPKTPRVPPVRPEIAAMAGYVPGEQPQEEGFVKLNTNENPYPPSPAVGGAIEEVLRRGLQKYPDPMGWRFRRAAAEVLGVPPEWILCGNGSDDILTIATRTFVGQGQLLRLPYPSYILYRSLAEIQGARSEEIFFRPDWSLAEQFAAPSNGLRLAFLPNPNSPSGTVVAPDVVLRIARQLPCPLVVDEAYVDFAETNCLGLVAECDKVIVSRSLSKSYALAGLRFGYAVAQPQLIEQMVKVKDSYNCDALAIAGAAAAIADRAWLAENRRKIIATRQRLAAGMRELGFVAVDSQANFTWNVHPEYPAKSLYEQLKSRRILVRYMNYPGWGDGLRISIGTDAQTDTCLDCLQAMLGGR